MRRNQQRNWYGAAFEVEETQRVWFSGSQEGVILAIQQAHLKDFSVVPSSLGQE